ncbi:MAG: polysaccharide biosynthesis/export family protein [Acidobacteriia bacterium]|nr:polysaccharide biosynthesis/export family protein [Terriglobia bacterium]
MRNPVRIASLMLLCLLLAVAAFAQRSQSGTAAAAPEMTNAASNVSGYIIGAEDVLQVNVWKEPEFSGAFPVRPDGKISLALLHDVQAAGLTPVQLSAAITDQLKKYLDAPRVTVIVTTINSRRIYLMGQVGRAGALPLQANMTVLQALSTAGGLAQFADAKKIYVLRKENGKQVRLPFNYKEVIKGNHPEQNFLLQPGDTIVVP